MRFGRELFEPWGLLLAATASGLAWAVQLPAVAVAGVGVAVLAARAGVASLGRSGGPAAPAIRLPDVDERSAEGRWLHRARSAATELAALSDPLAGGPLAERIGAMDGFVQETVTTLHQLAGRAATIGTALGHIDTAALAAERKNLAASLHTASDDVRAELERAAAAVQAQEDVHARLTAARTKLLAQLQSGALGLESLVARVAELSATGADTRLDTGALTDLTDQLEGIRRGVAETEQATRRALGEPGS